MPNSLNIEQNKPLKDYCTFGIGGPAKYFVEVRDILQMKKALYHCVSRKLPYFVLGKGSNCLFDDRGFNGMVILNKIDFLNAKEPGVFHVGAGYSFSLLGTQTARQGWSGLEFASGIPGSVGGAIFMNAGAQGGETSTHLHAVEFLSEDGELLEIKKENLSFGYRSSSFQNTKGVIVSGIFSLVPNIEARQKQINLLTYRKETQPIKDKSAGCIFRNPNGGHAGALIEKCGLKGINVGGAKVSEMHANFIVNKDMSSAQDVLALINLIKEKVKKETNFDLESEVRLIPYEADVKGDS